MLESENRPRLDDDTPPRPFDIDSIPEATHPTKTTKIANRVVLVALVLIAISLGVILRWALQPENALVVKNSPFPAQVIQQNGREVIILNANYCKNSNVNGTLRTSFVSSTREVFQPVTTEHLAKGCRNIDVPIIIPPGLPADTYRIKFHVNYDLNPLKKGVVVDFESQPIVVEASN